MILNRPAPKPRIVHQPLVHHFSLQAIISLTLVTFPSGCRSPRYKYTMLVFDDGYRDRANNYYLMDGSADPDNIAR